MKKENNNKFVRNQLLLFILLWMLPALITIFLPLVLIGSRLGLAALPAQGEGSWGDLFIRLIFAYTPYLVSILVAWFTFNLKKEYFSDIRIPIIFYIIYILFVTAYHFAFWLVTILFVFFWREDVTVYISALDAIKEYGGFVVIPVITFFNLRLALEKILAPEEKK